MTTAMQTRLEQAAALVEQALHELIPSECTYPASIHRAMRYSACGGGKRLRAMLVMEAAGLRSGSIKKAIPVAAAIEMIHAYSLIHDDLPAMDDDDYRRGKLSNHKVFGEGLAILAGDALLTHAFSVLARLPELTGVTVTVGLRVMNEVAKAAGTDGIIGGQVADLESEGLEEASTNDLAATLRYIHSRKTGALFCCALRSGAIVGGLSEADIEAVDSYAQHFGLAFQIIDDILDVVGDSKKLGKATGSDERKGKLTYPRLFGLDRSRQMAREAVDSAEASLAVFGAAATPLRDLARFILKRDC